MAVKNCIWFLVRLHRLKPRLGGSTLRRDTDISFLWKVGVSENTTTLRSVIPHYPFKIKKNQVWSKECLRFDSICALNELRYGCTRESSLPCRKRKRQSLILELKHFRYKLLYAWHSLCVWLCGRRRFIRLIFILIKPRKNSQS